jgi:DNA-binding NarL/FixJ family response regulator
MKQVIRIGLIDSDSAIRFGRKLLLDSQPEFQVVFESNGSVDDVEKISESLIDVLVIEHRLSVNTGADFLSRLRNSYTNPGEMPGVVLTCVYKTPEIKLEALSGGATALVAQEDGAEELLRAIAKAVKPAGVVKVSKLYEFLDQLKLEHELNPALVNFVNLLPEIDLNILRLLVAGKTDKLIAEELSLSAMKLHSAISRILASLGFLTRTQLMIALYRSGIKDEL